MNEIVTMHSTAPAKNNLASLGITVAAEFARYLIGRLYPKDIGVSPFLHAEMLVRYVYEGY